MIIIPPDADYDPSKAARDARKARITKNERQHQQNLAHAQSASASSSIPATADRKVRIVRTLAMTRTSTASMGKFDRTLEGEKKLKGVKRKVRSTPVQLNSITHCMHVSVRVNRSVCIPRKIT